MANLRLMLREDLGLPVIGEWVPDYDTTQLELWFDHIEHLYKPDAPYAFWLGADA